MESGRGQALRGNDDGGGGIATAQDGGDAQISKVCIANSA